jgi:signal transduction histidine kinase
LEPLPEETGLLDVIRQATERGSALTRQLLAFGRRQTLLPRPANLNDVVSGMESLLDATVGRRGKLVLQLAPDLASTLVDPEQIGHAILNIVMNAHDAMPEGGSVMITTSNVEIAGNGRHGLPPGRYVMMAIRDTGAGMEKTVRDRAFEPFFTTKEVGQGSGLGLSQVHGLMHQSGGSAEIDSVPGRGTTVRIYLPANSPD